MWVHKYDDITEISPRCFSYRKTFILNIVTFFFDLIVVKLFYTKLDFKEIRVNEFVVTSVHTIIFCAITRYVELKECMRTCNLYRKCQCQIIKETHIWGRYLTSQTRLCSLIFYHRDKGLFRTLVKMILFFSLFFK